MVPRTPLSTIDTWREESRAVSTDGKWELLLVWGREASHQRDIRHGNQRKRQGTQRGNWESGGLLYQDYLENNFQLMDRAGRRCWAWVNGWERTWVKVYLDEGQESRRDGVTGLQGTYLSD